MTLLDPVPVYPNWWDTGNVTSRWLGGTGGHESKNIS
jgi:hypothetical protein